MKKYELTKDDFDQIKQHGLSKEAVEDQLNLFQRGIPYVDLKEAATLENGIVKLSPAERDHFADHYEHATKSKIKFVPASGSASRMFKLLHLFLVQFDPDDDKLGDFLNKKQFKPLKRLFRNLEDLPFYPLVKAEMRTRYPDEETSSDAAEFYRFVQYVIDEMDYGSLPKGLIPFHHYEEKIVSAFEEHFYEAAEYSVQNDEAYLHFTVGEPHLEAFKSAFENFKSRLERETGVNFEVTYSCQQKSTDTIAVDHDNRPFRLDDNKLLIRPGGHGALIQNLNRIDADLIFIKNIDNVVPEENLERMVTYKKAIAGILIDVQEKIFSLLEDLDQNGFSTQLKERAERLSEERFHLRKNFQSEAAIRHFFDRPIRVCGMVENKGEPGGGPFWVNNRDGEISLQIVEGAQIDADDEDQKAILAKATHFNPVDIVAGVKNYKGQKFDLTEFVNADEGFITHKSINGTPLKALELPGLWNGAMAYWNTIFVEVPLETFNPVKTVIDLLKPSHQVKSLKREL